MYAVCLRYAHGHEQAQDMLQDGFIRVFNKLGQFRYEGSLEGWVRRIIVRTAIDHLRREAVQLVQIGDHRAEEPVVAEEALAALGVEELRGLISTLPDGYRTVFNLCAIDGYEHAEIARMLGIGESTSRSQLAKARRMLQLRIQEITTYVHTQDRSA